MKVYLLIILSMLTASCLTTRKVIDENLDTGEKNCRSLIISLIGQEKYKNSVQHLNSFGYGDPNKFTEKGFSKILYYRHTYRFSYKELINYEIGLATDTLGQLSNEINQRYNSLIKLRELGQLVSNNKKLDSLVQTGVQYFGDARFTIEFSNSKSNNIDYSREKDFTIEEIRNIDKSKIAYVLVDQDVIQESEYKRTRNAIIVDIKSKKIMQEIRRVSEINQ